MPILFKLILMLLSLAFGVACLRAPITVAYLIFQWAKLWAGDSITDPRAREAVFLVKNAPDEFERKFSGVMANIKRMGVVALVISIIGLCAIIFGS
jgi:hypothetical protein